MSGYKQDFLAIKYDYDTQCSMSDEVLTNYITALDQKINPTRDVGTLSGPYIGRNIPARKLLAPSGATVYYAQDGEYTKMVLQDGTARYYVGEASDERVLSDFYRGGQVPNGAYVYNPPQGEGLGTLYGSYISGEIPVIGKEVSPHGVTYYWALEGPYTKIVTVLDHDAYNRRKGDIMFTMYLEYRYDNTNNITSQGGKFQGAGRMPEGAYKYRPPVYKRPKKPSDSEIAAAFDPIGKHYANLLSVKERLNKFLEKASEDVADSEHSLASEDRYENRARPENSVGPKEIAYGLFTELRTSTIPVLLAVGVFMASISILMIFQMIGFTGQINVPPALIQLQARLMAPSAVPIYQNPMVLSGVSIVLGVAVVILGVMYFRAKQGQ
jgi:hypothetical protein